MKNLCITMLLCSSVFLFAKGKKSKVTAALVAPLASFEDSVSYCIGIQIANDLKKNGLDSLNVDKLSMGIKDHFKNDTMHQLTDPQIMSVLQRYFDMLIAERTKKKLSENADFLAKNAQKATIKKTQSGLQYEVIKEGGGARPKITDTVTVNYRGMFVDNRVFESSFEDNFPVSIPLLGVIPGWTEGVQLMTEGSLYRFYIPSELAYGEMGSYDGSIPPNEVLIFDIELVKIGKLSGQFAMPPAEDVHHDHDHDHSDPNHKH